MIKQSIKKTDSFEALSVKFAAHIKQHFAANPQSKVVFEVIRLKVTKTRIHFGLVNKEEWEIARLCCNALKAKHSYWRISGVEALGRIDLTLKNSIAELVAST